MQNYEIESCRKETQEFVALTIFDEIAEIFSLFKNRIKRLPTRKEMAASLTKAYLASIMISILSDLDRKKEAWILGIGVLRIDGKKIQLDPFQIKSHFIENTNSDVTNDEAIRQKLTSELESSDLFSSSHITKIKNKIKTNLPFFLICQEESERLAPYFIDKHEKLNQKMISGGSLFYACLGIFRIAEGVITFTPSEDFLLIFGLTQ